MSFWSDLLAVISSSAGNEAGVTAPTSSVGPDLATKTAAGQFLTLTEGIWTELSDGKMWRSAGWLFLGVVLMLLGVLWWIGPSAARQSPGGMIARQVT